MSTPNALDRLTALEAKTALLESGFESLRVRTMELSVAIDAIAEIVGTDRVAEIIKSKAAESKADFVSRARQHFESEVQNGNSQILDAVPADGPAIVFIEESIEGMTNLGFVNTADLSPEAKEQMLDKKVDSPFEFNGAMLIIRAIYSIK